MSFEWQTVWRTTTDLDPRLLRRWHAGPLTAFAWHSDDRRPLLAVGCRDWVRIWDLVSGPVLDLPVDTMVLSLAFASSDAGPVLISGDLDGLRVWNVESGALVASDLGLGQVRDLGVVETSAAIAAGRLVDGRPVAMAGGRA
ncbi:WD40 repeat domain-containing protein [Paractinoplanes atraurantiacus]|uniref:WD domain-containing protein, G-beta repeat-containing protein n=1 Tax=Paractinoplanes atraurantiacus TaxID=1036182 RepID=A0A285JIL6_9ACTN|nr:WD40 repeat domain-containing protein [Actinoplanes atraurantiacus]SNY60170.1 hypothetical protein SAMN05421748_12165 [Actinoplanes atraurantiacus]